MFHDFVAVIKGGGRKKGRNCLHGLKAQRVGIYAR